MSPSPAWSRSVRRRSAAGRRFGYVLAIAINAVVLWVAHQLLPWRWPDFLTGEFADVLPLISASLVASMLANAAFVLYDRGRFRALADLITAGFGLAVTARLWVVFPFDFAGYGSDWSWLLRVALVVGFVATATGAIAHLVKLVRPGRGLPKAGPRVAGAA